MRFFLSAFCLFTLCLQAESQIRICGRVYDSGTGSPLSRCHILVANSKRGTVTDRDGHFCIRLQSGKDYVLHFSYVGYEAQSRKVSTPLDPGDTLRLALPMDFMPITGKVFTVHAGSRPDTVTASAAFNIGDFLLDDDGITALTYNKSLSKDPIIRRFHHKRELRSLALPDGTKAKELYRDYLGRSWIIAENMAYLINDPGHSFTLQKVALDTFTERIKPAEDTLGNKIFFSDFRWYNPEFDYYAYLPVYDSVEHLAHVEDSTLSHLYRMSYYFASPREKLIARKMERETGLDKRYIAGRRSGFTHSPYYTPLYAPLFVIDDTVMLFDHYSNHLYQFNRHNEEVGRVPISYHHLETAGKWQQQLIIDELTEDIYSIYRRQGYTYLGHVNVRSGSLDFMFKLSYKYVERIRIRDGFSYYIYRPEHSIQRKFLYRERIGSSQEE